MELNFKIELSNRRFEFLNVLLAGALQVGNITEIEKISIDIKSCQDELEELLKQQEDANREPELPVD
jgi:hypothetical protein